jgi:hypothetical protein
MKTSSVGWQTETLGAQRPETFRLPRKQDRDPFFGFARSHYYVGEANGWWRLIRIRQKGKQRGVTLVPYDQVAEFVRAQMEAN